MSTDQATVTELDRCPLCNQEARLKVLETPTEPGTPSPEGALQIDLYPDADLKSQLVSALRAARSAISESQAFNPENHVRLIAELIPCQNISEEGEGYEIRMTLDGVACQQPAVSTIEKQQRISADQVAALQEARKSIEKHDEAVDQLWRVRDLDNDDPKRGTGRTTATLSRSELLDGLTNEASRLKPLAIEGSKALVNSGHIKEAGDLLLFTDILCSHLHVSLRAIIGNAEAKYEDAGLTPQSRPSVAAEWSSRTGGEWLKDLCCLMKQKDFLRRHAPQLFA